MKKSAILAALLALASVMVIYQNYPATATRRQAQNQPKKQDKREQSRAVYKGLGNSHGQKIREVVAQAKGDVRIETEIGLPVFNPFAQPFNLQEFLRGRSCDADAIVTGTVNRQVSQLTEDESFVYTDNELKVEEVIKENPHGAINVGDCIMVARTGGTIRLSGRTVIAEYKAAKPLKVGNRYLLFLTFLPDRAVYAADNITYQLHGDKIHKLTEEKLNEGLESGSDVKRLIDEVRAAAASSCGTTEGD